MCRKPPFYLLLAMPFFLSVQPAWASPPSGSSEEVPPEDPLERALILIDESISLQESLQNEIELLRQTNDSSKTALTNLSNMLTLQGALLREQAGSQRQLSLISERQATLLGKELKKGKILKVSLIVSVPLFTGLGIWIGTSLTR